MTSDFADGALETIIIADRLQYSDTGDYTCSFQAGANSVNSETELKVRSKSNIFFFLFPAARNLESICYFKEPCRIFSSAHCRNKQITVAQPTEGYPLVG